MLVGEVWLPDAERFARYLRPDELHTAFNFDFLACPWEPGPMRSLDRVGARRARARRCAGHLGALEPRRHPPGHPLRPRRHALRVRERSARARRPTSRAGARRARAAALLAMALPGSMYIYQGEELGLPEVEDIPPDRRQDPMWLRSGGVDPGRDGCRVPLPWSGAEPPYGFSPNAEARAWLDQPDDWAPLSVEAQTDDPDVDAQSLPRRFRLRREAPWGADAGLRWLDYGDEVIAFARGDGFTCIVNFGPSRWSFPPRRRSWSPARARGGRCRRTPRSGSCRPETRLRRGGAKSSVRRRRRCTLTHKGQGEERTMKSNTGRGVRSYGR